jgi:steroid delta-isomerase-like uncharacterized protein
MERSPDNERNVRRFIDEVFNGGNMRILRELIAPDHVSHLPAGDHYGPDGVRIGVEELRRGFPDLHLTVDELFSAEDRVVWRFTATGTHSGDYCGNCPTGKRVCVEGMTMDRLREGQMIERWVQFDSAGLLAQIGAIQPGRAGICPDS